MHGQRAPCGVQFAFSEGMGTHFGLQLSARTASTLLKMLPLVPFLYPQQDPKGSFEMGLLEEFLLP